MKLERMRITAAPLLLLTALLFAPAQGQTREDARVTVSFDKGRRFFKGDAEGAEHAEFDDSKW